MRYFKNFMLVLVTLALAAAGAAMPFAASRLQDARQTGVEVRSVDSFVLTLEKKSEFSKFLRFLNEEEAYFYAAIGVDKEAGLDQPRMSKDEALEMSREAVALLAQCGIISQEQLEAALDAHAEKADQPNARALVMYPKTDARNSHIIWIVEWVNVNIGLYLDDASGKACYIGTANFWSYGGESFDSNVASTGMSSEYFYAQMENWCRFVEKYYEVALQDFEETPAPHSSSQYFSLLIDLEDGGDWFPMKLYIRENGATLTAKSDW